MKIKECIKSLFRKNLVNKKALRRIVAGNPICQHAIKELKLAGYGKGEGGPNDWMYQQVIEAVAVFASHGNSGGSAPYEISLVRKLCSWDVISPLTFYSDDEWQQISEDGTCQNKRKSDVFKDPDGRIHYNGAFTKRPTERYDYKTKQWTKNENPISWDGGLFEHKDNVLTGRYFCKCFVKIWDKMNGWLPKEPRTIDCVEVETAPDDWIMAVDSDSSQMCLLSCLYDIEWKECPCMKGIRLEDVTPELEEEAYIEIKYKKISQDETI